MNIHCIHIDIFMISLLLQQFFIQCIFFIILHEKSYVVLFFVKSYFFTVFLVKLEHIGRVVGMSVSGYRS